MGGARAYVEGIIRCRIRINIVVHFMYTFHARVKWWLALSEAIDDKIPAHRVDLRLTVKTRATKPILPQQEST